MIESKKERAIVLLSGGIDSAVCLWLAKEANWEIYSISFNYYNRQKREIRASAALAQRANVIEHKEIELPFLKELADHAARSASFPEDIPRAYIPSRNLIFYSIATSWAESISAMYVIGGHNSIDHSNFPDSTPSFFSKLNEIIRIGARSEDVVEVITPLSKLDKVGVLREAIRLNVPLELTWSCYDRDDLACGVCDACKIRLRAFSNLKIPDPIYYAETISKRA